LVGSLIGPGVGLVERRTWGIVLHPSHGSVHRARSGWPCPVDDSSEPAVS
jgi:hypothetical protein